MAARLSLVDCCCDMGMGWGDAGEACKRCPVRGTTRHRQLCDGSREIRKDECAIFPDLCTNGRCINTPTGYRCECNQGFRLLQNRDICEGLFYTFF
ncbi:hypothetical protein KUTeg_017965 [Tegillarca granosa]|uniref:Uncharacterized protein n=1 Tax=Tegillarca granosa TaxID=220873 RepID=A0ABQ9EKC2_TEGGR|nr:hypothetical protein KUTeg_017965 [Tegillarca granosa]